MALPPFPLASSPAGSQAQAEPWRRYLLHTRKLVPGALHRVGQVRPDPAQTLLFLGLLEA